MDSSTHVARSTSDPGHQGTVDSQGMSAAQRKTSGVAGDHGSGDNKKWQSRTSGLWLDQKVKSRSPPNTERCSLSFLSYAMT